MNTYQKGKNGEDSAVRHLQQNGFRVLERNYRTRRAEVDIVGMDGSELVFVEVKAWTTFGIEEAEYAIGKEKKRRIIGASRAFLAATPGLAGRRVRYDCVFLDGNGVVRSYLRDAFTE